MPEPTAEPTPSPAAELAGLRDATERLLAAVATLDDAAVGRPSRLPGWTRGHLLAHLAHHADAMVNVLEGRPMYPGEEARDAAIERDAGRPAAVHHAEIEASAARLAAAAAARSGADWAVPVTFRGGVRGVAADVPLRRWTEVELHHVDLDVGHGIADLSGAFLTPAPGYLAARFAGRGDVPPLLLRSEDGRSWRTGSTDPDAGPPRTVAGTPAALVGWLSGRTSGSGLTSAGPLPVLPPL
ncbi:maleylpyruvate isomerase family mycothiol-dependent enzyme [Streptomyces hoynatensis]|uniref:Maleylpyruvate isomerase family mycothiol-dependent enzyme n=1 Tax=Streptomyces hoynatensis TaxID=1141874 RepID=A0A3A9Z1S1_9ACTN|nr:maleylpyruvate isomerase family mycothiol-dependent enzyme [Streptomyces hoynatensis]RKN42392.1 maleylpyruvate isomerase family mycothiol-dependent enzyme [Streptomyces hoynatensis]